MECLEVLKLQESETDVENSLTKLCEIVTNFNECPRELAKDLSIFLLNSDYLETYKHNNHLCEKITYVITKTTESVEFDEELSNGFTHTLILLATHLDNEDMSKYFNVLLLVWHKNEVNCTMDHINCMIQALNLLANNCNNRRKLLSDLLKTLKAYTTITEYSVVILAGVLRFVSHPNLDSNGLIDPYNCIYEICKNYPTLSRDYLLENFYFIETMLMHLATKFPVIRKDEGEALYSPLLGVISAIVNCDELCQKILANGILKLFYEIIAKATPLDEESVRQIYCIISVSTAGEAKNFEMILADTDFFSQLLDNLQNGSLAIKLETAWSISNSTVFVTVDLLQRVLDKPVIETFCGLFNQYSVLKGTHTIEWSEMFLEAFENWLVIGDELVDDNLVLYNPVALKIAECGGLDTLKQLEADFALAPKILTHFFGDEYEKYLAWRRGLKTKRAL